MKFLMIYPNNTGTSRVPLGIAYLLTILREQGHIVKFFDMTFYGVDLDKHFVNVRAENLCFRGVDLTPYGVTYKKSTMQQVRNDLIQEIEKFKPDVIGVSISEETSWAAFDLANTAKKVNPGTKLVFGGLFCTANPEAVIRHPAADIVCIAEGEVAVPELLHNLEQGENIDKIQGLWIKKDEQTIVRNPVADPIDLDELPFLDLNFLDDRHFYFALAGHVYKMTYLGTQRSCPRNCSYCSNQMFHNMYRQKLKAFVGRKMSVPRIIDNLVHLKENYAVNFFQFADDDFMLRSLEDIKNFAALYKKRIDLPFWIQAEANNITDEKVHYLKDAGLIAVAIGIETGNEYIRKKVFNRLTTREATLRAFRVLHKYGVRTSGNVIIGVPHEGRKEIFDTINFVRKCKPSAINVNLYLPYHGTKLRDYCVGKGYIDKDYVQDGHLTPLKLVLNMPQITRSEIDGLVRTFALYVTLPKKYWPMIKKCEDFTEESDEIFGHLEKLFWPIAEKRGIDYDVPGFDYESFFQKRCKELEEKKAKVHGTKTA